MEKKEIIKREKERVKKLKEKTKSGVKAFRKEFKKETNTALMAAFGFLIALVWRDVVKEAIDRFSGDGTLLSSVIGAVIVTGLCVLGIMITSRMLKEKEEVKNETEKK